MAVATRITWRLVERVVPPGRSRLAEALEGAWRLATLGDHQAVWNQTVSGDTWMRQVLSGAELDRVEDFTQLWMEVLMRCFVGA